MTTAPTDLFAIHFDNASEMNAPPKPNILAKIRRELRLSPWSLRYGSTPSNRILIDSTSTIAKLVVRNKNTLFTYLLHKNSLHITSRQHQAKYTLIISLKLYVIKLLYLGYFVKIQENIAFSFSCLRFLYSGLLDE